MPTSLSLTGQEAELNLAARRPPAKSAVLRPPPSNHRRAHRLYLLLYHLGPRNAAATHHIVGETPFPNCRLSALPNAVLLRILAVLGDAAVAGRTSVLASQWRRLWAILPELRFPFPADPRAIATDNAAHESVAAWLGTAAVRRPSDVLAFTNRVPAGKNNHNDDGVETRGAFELPCLASATAASLDIGCLGIAVLRAARKDCGLSPSFSPGWRPAPGAADPGGEQEVQLRR